MIKQTKPKFAIGDVLRTHRGEVGTVYKIGRPGGDAYDPKKRHPNGRWQYAMRETLVRWHPEAWLEHASAADRAVAGCVQRIKPGMTRKEALEIMTEAVLGMMIGKAIEQLLKSDPRLREGIEAAVLKDAEDAIKGKRK